MENISLRDVADELGLRVETRTDNRIDYFCPIHDQETGDLSLYPESHFACHKKGGESPVTLLMHCKGFTFEEAKEWMAEKFPEKWGSEKIDKEHIERKQKVQEVLDKAVELSQGQLTEKQEQSICEKRNLEHKDILEHKVGYFNQKVVETLKERYSKQVLKNSGLFSYNENGLYPFLKDRIVIPYLKFDKVRYLIGRKTKESKDAKYKKLKQTEYNEHILWTYEKPKKNCLVITEGIYDAISVAKAGYPVCSPVTTQFSKKQVDKVVNYAKNFEEVYIAMDGDEAGQEGQKKTAKQLANKEVTVNLVSLPEGMDFDDWTTENGYDISVLLEESKSFVQSIIENHNKAESLKQTDIAREEIYPVIKNWSTGKRSKVFKELDGNKRDTETDYKEWLEEKESQKKPQHEDNEEDEDNEAHSLSLSNLLEEVKPEKVRLSGELEDGEYFYTIPVTKGERTIPLVITSNKEIIQVKHKLKEKRKKRDGELSKEDRKAYDYRYFEYNGKEYRFKHKPVFFQQLDLYNNDNSVLKYLEENNPSKDVYRRVRERIKKYWDHPNSEYFDVATAWVIHTYLINNIGYTVYLMLKGLEDTGKSTLQKILARLSYNGFFTGKTTPAVSSRLAHFTQSSIQIDEFEKLGEEAKTQIQGVFNTGQRRG